MLAKYEVTLTPGALCGQVPRCATTLCARPTRSRARLRNRGMSRVDERSTNLSCGRTPRGLARGGGGDADLLRLASLNCDIDSTSLRALASRQLALLAV